MPPCVARASGPVLPGMYAEFVGVLIGCTLGDFFTPLQRHTQNLHAQFPASKEEVLLQFCGVVVEQKYFEEWYLF